MRAPKSPSNPPAATALRTPSWPKEPPSTSQCTHVPLVILSPALFPKIDMIVSGPVSQHSYIVRGLLLLSTAPAIFAQNAPDYRAFLDKYCVTCHNEKTKTG